jgi:hypothetical protein
MWVVRAAHGRAIRQPRMPFASLRETAAGTVGGEHGDW